MHERLPSLIDNPTSQHAHAVAMAAFDSVDNPFAAAVRATRMPMLITDPRLADNPVVFVNDAFCRLTGYSRAETMGRNCRFLQGPETDPVQIDRIRTAVRNCQPIELDLRNHRKDGSPFWNRLLVIPVHDVDGALAYFFANQFDVTFERERLAVLQDQNAALEERVAERTHALVEANKRLQAEGAERELAEEALRQAHKMEAIGQLTGGIAHDFNNMLQGISGSLELIRRRIAQGRLDDAIRFVDNANKGLSQAAALTKRLLSFARRQPLQSEPVVVDELIEGMAELIRSTVGPGVQVALVMADGAWTIRCDSNQLESALLNLVINARDAMPDGGLLTIGTREVKLAEADIAGMDEAAKTGDYVLITVADTGSGMDDVTRQRVFEPFFTTKPLGRGTGLGLSQLYGFVRQSSGIVRLSSTLGQGTTFSLYLPRNETSKADHDMPAQSEQGHVVGNETVLLVEDEGSVRAITAEWLSELGYTVIQAEDGSAALQVLGSVGRVDLLITDVGLPNGLNGRQIADVAREDRADLPVLFITGYADAAFDGPLPPGMALIGKPFELDVLATCVRGLLGAAGVR